MGRTMFDFDRCFVSWVSPIAGGRRDGLNQQTMFARAKRGVNVVASPLRPVA